MKNLFLFLLIVFCFSCNNPSKYTVKFASINGKINHSKNDIHLVELFSRVTRFGIDKPNHSVALDSSGNYRFEIPIKHPTEVRLKYGGYSKILFVEPQENLIFNKTVSFDFYPNKKVNPSFKLDTIVGTTADLSLKMNDFDQLFKDSFQVELNATLSYAIPREFKTNREKITKRIRHFTKAYIKEHANNNQILANWANSHSEYRIAMDYMKYAFKLLYISSSNPSLKEELFDYYFDFLKEFPVNNPKAIISLNYQNYLLLYRKYLMAKLEQTIPYKDCKNLPNCNFYELEIAELSQLLEGEALNFSLIQQMDKYLTRNNPQFLKSGFDQYLSAIKDSLLTQEIQSRKDYLYDERTFDYPESVTLYQSTGKGEQILREIAKKHQGRITLLYFWNTESGIIRSQLSKAERQPTWSMLDTLNFDLVMLAHHSTPNSWKENIIENGLMQDQWHLTDAQYDFFKNHFDNKSKNRSLPSIFRDNENFILALDEQGNLIYSGLHGSLSSLPHEIRRKQNRKYNSKTIGYDQLR